MSISLQDRLRGKLSQSRASSSERNTDIEKPLLQSGLHSPKSLSVLPSLPLSSLRLQPCGQFAFPIHLQPPAAISLPDHTQTLPSPRPSISNFASPRERVAKHLSSSVIPQRKSVAAHVAINFPTKERTSAVSKSGEVIALFGTRSEKQGKNQEKAKNEKSRSLAGSPTMENQQKSKADYVPYTLQDYHSIKREHYLEMGVFGPSTIGSEDWTHRKQLQARRKAYARIVLQNNCNRIAISLGRPARRKNESPQANSRLKALAFAKTIRLPCAQPRDYAAEWDYAEAERQQLREIAEDMRRKLLS